MRGNALRLPKLGEKGGVHGPHGPPPPPYIHHWVYMQQYRRLWHTTKIQCVTLYIKNIGRLLLLHAVISCLAAYIPPLFLRFFALQFLHSLCVFTLVSLVFHYIKCNLVVCEANATSPTLFPLHTVCLI